MERLSLAAADDVVGGTLLRPTEPARLLLACIHGGGCHSGYFEAGPALARAAVAAGHGVLLVDRPGTRGRPLLDAARPLAPSVAPIAAFVAQVARAENLPVMLVGHSIGAALALTIAAEAPDRLAGVAVSGLGDEPPERIRRWPVARADPLSTDVAALFLGPEGTYDWRGLAQLRRVLAPWTHAERLELVEHWPQQWRALASRIRVPVQLRLAEAENIWLTGEAVVARMAAALTAAPHVDAAILPEGGHLYEFHKRGGELVAQQLAFAGRVAG